MGQTLTGTTNFLFTRIKGSALLWEQNPQAMQLALARHDEILRSCVKAHQGNIFILSGEGFCATFEEPSQAFAAASESQQALNRQDWGELSGGLQVAMALHCGEFRKQENNYYGPAFERGLRILAVAHSDQILVSGVMAQELRPESGLTLCELGEHLLQDLGSPEHLFQLNQTDLCQEFPPLLSLNNWPHNLPPQSSPIIGREQELKHLQTLLDKRGQRLITFTGPGGTGKTRLSLQLAAEVLHSFPDGVFVVELATVRQPVQVASAISRTLGLKESSGRELLNNLKQYLSEKRLLLVLDNFEQVVEAGSLVAELLGAASGLRVLVSSRIPLKIYGEQEFPVPPLANPANKSALSLEELEQYPAIQLFVERAWHYRPGFTLTDENAKLITKICARLDGLPLAIELAAARIQMFQLETILNGLSNRLQTLSSSSSYLPARHQTLRNTIEWSYNLLDPEEQLLFSRSGIFAGSFSLEAAEAICNPAEEAVLDPLDGLTSLADKSLVSIVVEPGKDEPRFKLLETIREFALEQLRKSGELEELRQNYLNFFYKLAQEAEPELTGPEQAEWFRKLELEHANFQDIMDWVLKEKETVKFALELGNTLWRFWLTRGYITEGRLWLETALLKSEAEAEATNKSLLLQRARTYNALAILARNESDFGRAKILLEQGLIFHRQLDDKTGLASTLNTLGTVAAYLGQYEEALKFHQETLTLRRELGDKRGIAISLCNLGTLLGVQQHYLQAKEVFEEALSLLRQLGDKRSTALLLNNLGSLWLALDNPMRAKKFSEESLLLYRELEDQDGIGLALLQLADIAKAQNNFGEAVNLYRQSLANLSKVKENADLPLCLEGLAGALVHSGELELAAQLFGASEALREENNSPLLPMDQPRYEREVANLSHQLDKLAFNQAWEAGRKMSVDEIIRLACGKLQKDWSGRV
jgi:predicted ATPase/class 3 adenylate cyclase/Tfp pilus assembly protein PilF